MKGRSDKRTTVSLAEVVWKMAEERMDAKGFNDNFSSYVADLIRRDMERAGAANPVPPTAAISSAPAPAAAGTAHKVIMPENLGVFAVVEQESPPKSPQTPRSKRRSSGVSKV